MNFSTRICALVMLSLALFGGVHARGIHFHRHGYGYPYRRGDALVGGIFDTFNTALLASSLSDKGGRNGKEFRREVRRLFEKISDSLKEMEKALIKLEARVEALEKKK